MNRRTFLVGTGIYFAGSTIARAVPDAPFADLEAALGGRVGVMAIDTRDGSQVSHRADERFAMCSTFKWALAAFVLAQVDKEKMALDERLHFSAEDLLDYAPVAQQHVDTGWLTVQMACRASVTLSDNTAANLLLQRVGGPDQLTSFLRETGDAVTRLDRNEPGLNTNIAGDERDTTTPRAMAGSMQRMLVGNVLSSASRDRLNLWLKETTTGLARLRAGLPTDWSAGDKTGTCANGAANDVAIAWPPHRSPVLVASYLSESQASPDALNEAHANIARIVATHFS